MDLQELIGKTISDVKWGETEGAYGLEPIVTLYFTDESSHTFVLPKEED
jgi:hypothetical protein